MKTVSERVSKPVSGAFRFSLTGLLTLSLTAFLAAQDCCNWPTNRTWTAPEPALPGTEYWFYGWDSTSNGIPPAEVFAAQRAAHRARLQAMAPLPPPPRKTVSQSVSKPVSENRKDPLTGSPAHPLTARH